MNRNFRTGFKAVAAWIVGCFLCGAVSFASPFELLEFSATELSGNGSIEPNEEVLMRLVIAHSGSTEGTARVEASYPLDFGDFTPAGGKVPSSLVETATGFVATWDFNADEVAILQYRIRAPSCFEQATATHFGRLFDHLTGETVDSFSSIPIPITGASFFNISIDKTATVTSAVPDEVIPWTLEITNHGNTHRQRISVREAQPLYTEFEGGSPEFAGCTSEPCQTGLITLDCSESLTLQYSARVDPVIGAEVNEICNTAELIRAGFVRDDSESCVPIDGGSLTVDLVASNSTSSPEPGPDDTVIFDLGVTNTGNSTAEHVEWVETVPMGSSFLASGSSGVWSCTDGAPAGTECRQAVGVLPGKAVAAATFAVVVSDPLPSGVFAITNTVRIEPLAGDENPSNNTATASIPIDGSALMVDLVASKTTTSAEPGPGATVVFEVGVRNEGNSQASGVELVETVPAGTLFLASASTGTWSCPGGSGAGTECRQAVGALAGSGGAFASTFAVRVLDPLPAGMTRVTNTLRVDPVAGDPTPSNNTASSTISIDADSLFVDLIGTVTSDQGSVGPGDGITFGVGVINAGNVAAMNVELKELVPEGTRFELTGSTVGWSCSDGAPAGSECRLPIGTLDGGGASEHANFRVVVLDALPAGLDEIVDVVTALPTLGDADPSDNSAESRVSIELGPGDGPNLEMAKSADVATAGAGDRIHWTVKVRNGGNVGAGPVTLTDAVPAHTVVAAGSSTAWTGCPAGSSAGTVCEIQLPSLAAFEERSFALVTDVVSPLPAGVGEFVNTVRGETAGEVDPSNDEATYTVSVQVGGDHGPDVALGKIADRTETMEGELIVYTLTVSSVGDQGASAVTVTETVPEWTTWRQDAGSPGWSCADGSCTFAVGTLEVGETTDILFGAEVASRLPPEAFQILNQATVAAAVDQNAENDQASLRINLIGAPPPMAPDLRVRLDDGDVVVRPGVEGRDLVTYMFELDNHGNETGQEVELTLEIEAPVHAEGDFTVGGISGSCTESTSRLRCLVLLGDLEVDGLLTGSLEVLFPEGIEGPEVQAIAEVSSSEELDPVDNRSVVTTSVVPFVGTGEVVLELKDLHLPRVLDEVTRTAIEEYVDRWNEDHGLEGDDAIHPGSVTFIRYQLVLVSPSLVSASLRPRTLPGSFPLDPLLTTVVTDHGTVIIEGSVITEGSTWKIELGSVLPAGSVVVQWVEAVRPDTPPNLSWVERQVVLQSHGRDPSLSDDPDTRFAEDDATRSLLSGWGTPIAVPAMGHWGMALLGMCLLGVAIRRLKP